MGKDPAVLFYTSDFLSGTSFFTMEEVGQYITLLCQQHQLKSIPESQIIKICGSLNSIVVSKFKKDTDGTYYNERMRIEADKRSSFCESRRKSIKNRYVRSTHVEHTNIRMENENENENRIKDKNEKSLKKPLIEEIKAYCTERNNAIDPQSFFDFYESKGWMIGKNKMKNWQAAIRTWEKNNVPTGRERNYRTTKTGFSGNNYKNNSNRPGYDEHGKAIGAVAKPGEFDEGVLTLDGVPDHR